MSFKKNRQRRLLLGSPCLTSTFEKIHSESLDLCLTELFTDEYIAFTARVHSCKLDAHILQYDTLLLDIWCLWNMTYHILFTLFPILTVLVLPFRHTNDCPLTTFFFIKVQVQSLLAKSAENMLLVINKHKWIIMLWHIINGLTSRFTYTVNEYMHILLQSREQLYTVILFVNPKLSEHQKDSENDRTTPLI